ncbi:MAG: hypothetical protein AAFO59_07380, partial [Cyanobacteria bacterium J06607_17]
QNAGPVTYPVSLSWSLDVASPLITAPQVRDNSYGPFPIPDMKERLIAWLNTALMINLFFVLASFVWFVAALAGRATQVNLGFDLWYSLWDPLFMPSIGILMAGAIISGIVSWVSRRFFAG